MTDHGTQTGWPFCKVPVLLVPLPLAPWPFWCLPQGDEWSELQPEYEPDKAKSPHPGDNGQEAHTCPVDVSEAMATIARAAASVAGQWHWPTRPEHAGTQTSTTELCNRFSIFTDDDDHDIRAEVTEDADHGDNSRSSSKPTPNKTNSNKKQRKHILKKIGTNRDFPMLEQEVGVDEWEQDSVLTRGTSADELGSASGSARAHSPSAANLEGHEWQQRLRERDPADDAGAQGQPPVGNDPNVDGHDEHQQHSMAEALESGNAGRTSLPTFEELPPPPEPSIREVAVRRLRERHEQLLDLIVDLEELCNRSPSTDDHSRLSQLHEEFLAVTAALDEQNPGHQPA